MSSPSTYVVPVAQLLSYGSCRCVGVEDWPDYVAELGLTPDHIPALIQITQDETLWQLFWRESDEDDDDASISDNNASINTEAFDPDVALWAPIHAWRCLGKLQAAEAVKPLANVLEQQDIDWCWEELPQVFGLIGSGAIAPLDQLLSEDYDYNSKITLTSGLSEIGKRFPDQRDRCIEVLTRHLSNYDQHHISLNGGLVTALYHLQAVEAAPTMAAAYAAGKVDEMFVGSWARVQVDLGLKQESDFTPEELAVHHTPEQEKMLANIRAYLNTNKPKALELGLPLKQTLKHREDTPEILADLPQVSAANMKPKSGFGASAKPKAKKRKKK